MTPKNVPRQKSYGGKASRIVIVLDEGNGTGVDVLHNTVCDKPFKRSLTR